MHSTATDRPCSSAPASETTSTDIKVCSPAGPVHSLPSSVGSSPQQLHCILAASPLGCEPGPPLPLHCPSDSAISHGQRTVSSEPGCNKGIIKGRSSRHQNSTELSHWVIAITALLQTWVCFAILPPHSKWICWVIVRKRKRQWPILRPSDLGTKREKILLHCFPLVFLNKNNV